MLKVASKFLLLKKSPDLLIILLLGILSMPVFFYKLGSSSLVSWDEAWHAVIARNLLLSGDLFHLVYNNETFVDHPPGGYWLIALSFKLFGINEFNDRLVGAGLGFLCLIIIYLIGKVFFNRVVGLASAVALFSSTWFLYRARSGNLDIPLTFFFLLTLYLGIKAAGNKKFFIPFSLSLSYLTLIKAALPFTILPALLVIFFPNRLFRIKVRVFRLITLIWSSFPKDLAFQLYKKTYSVRDVILPIGLIVLFLGGWVLGLYLENSSLADEFVNHGRRGVELESEISVNFQRTLQYIHNGIGKWYWPGLISLLVTPFLFQKRFLVLTIFFVSFILPFIFSAEGELWHLIPVYPFLILSFFGFLYFLLELGFNIFLSKLKFLKKKYWHVVTAIIILGIAGYYGFLQSRANWFNFVNIAPYFSDEAILSREASFYPQKLLIDDDFIPAALFYSKKNEIVKIFRGDLENKLLGNESFLMITNDWRINQSSVSASRYRIIKKDRDKVLILKL